jgi:hypothetical protein
MGKLRDDGKAVLAEHGLALEPSRFGLRGVSDGSASTSRSAEELMSILGRLPAPIMLI